MNKENEIVSIENSPVEIIQKGREMARMLQAIVSQTKGALVLNGKQYLRFEDWQTLAKFFGLTVKTGKTEILENGAKAVAEVVNRDGIVVGGAEGYCFRDEKNWAGKPMFQIISMAQTRAGAKALRNILGWVAVLAGFEGTPAEEVETEQKVEKHTSKLSDKQRRAIFASAGELGISEEEIHERVKKMFGKEHISNLTSKEARELINAINKEIYLKKKKEKEKEVKEDADALYGAR